VEPVLFSDNPRTALILGHARGVALVAVALAEVQLVEYAALEITMAVGGCGRAARSLGQLMGGLLRDWDAAPQPADAADALAAAICHMHTHSFRRRLTR
jgi:crossover junction endodeoxyribonuclease RuvC